MSDETSPASPDFSRLLEIVAEIARSYPEQAEKLDVEASGDRERGTALALVARLDVELQDALRNVMIDDKTAVDQIFSENGPLFQFGPKIRIAYAFGIVDKIVYNDLVIVSKIRNDFAHKIAATSFRWDRIRSNVQNLRIVDYYKQRYGLDYFDLLFSGAKKAFPEFDGTMTTEVHFIGCVHLLSLSVERSAAYAAEFLLSARDDGTFDNEDSNKNVILGLGLKRVIKRRLHASLDHFRRFGARLNRR